jgi:uncharacterized membrane protein
LTAVLNWLQWNIICASHPFLKQEYSTSDGQIRTLTKKKKKKVEKMKATTQQYLQLSQNEKSEPEDV